LRARGCPSLRPFGEEKRISVANRPHATSPEKARYESQPEKHSPSSRPGVLQRSRVAPRVMEMLQALPGSVGASPSHEAPDKREVIGKDHSIGESQPV
jgi:hypothetical protein